MKNNWLVLAFLIIVFIYARFFISSVDIANDLHFAYPETFLNQFSVPQTWLTSNETLLMWNRPLITLTGLMGLFGLSFSLVIKVTLFIGFLVLGFWVITKLLKSLGVEELANIVGSVLYLSNSYILLIIDGGQISIALAYAWFPVSYLASVKGVCGNLKTKIIAGLAIGVLGFFDIRFIYILLVLLLIRFLYEFIFSNSQSRLQSIFNWFAMGLLSGIIFVGLNFYWLMPSFLSRSPGLPATYIRESQTSFLNFTQLKHTFSLLQPHWYENIFGKIAPFRKEFLLIPVLVFLAPVLRRKDKQVWFWTVVALVSVFLTKGANPPFPEVYPWLFVHIPGFSLFRDSTKFFFLVALSYSVLISFTVDELTKRFSQLKIILPILLIFYLVFLVRPVYSGKMTGTFSEPRYKTEYFSLAEKLEADENFGRIFWLPSRAPLGFASQTHPSVDAIRLESLRPFATGTVGTYETNNFIREGALMGEIFDIASVRYIAYPYFDPRRDEMKPDNIKYYNTFLGQISRLPWIGEKISDIPVSVFKTKKNQDHFFMAPNTWVIVGSNAIYADLAKVPGFDLARNALVFPEEQSGECDLVNEIGYSKVILYAKGGLDLAACFIKKDEFIFPAEKLVFSPNETGWWKRETSDFVWWKNFLQEKYKIDNRDFDYKAGWAVGEGNVKLQISNAKLKKGNMLLARVMKSSKGGKVGFYQNDNLIGEINTKIERPEKVVIKLTGYNEIPDKYSQFDKADFSWINVGQLVDDSELSIKTEGEINVVNALAGVSPEELEQMTKTANELLRSGRVFIWANMTQPQKNLLFSSEEKTTVTYRRLAPTHYKVKIEGLEKPATLAFSETFDPLWQAGGMGSYKLYSLINGFWIDHNGEYDIYFSAQKYVLPGLFVSGATLLVVGIILYKTKAAKRSYNLN